MVDTSRRSIALFEFENANWYAVEGDKVQSSAAPAVIWNDTSMVIHYNNASNMVATNMYLQSTIDLSYLFDYNRSTVKDSVHGDYHYKIIENDSLRAKLVDGEWTSVNLKAGLESYYFIDIQTLVDVNGDGVF